EKAQAEAHGAGASSGTAAAIAPSVRRVTVTLGAGVPQLTRSIAQALDDSRTRLIHLLRRLARFLQLLLGRVLGSTQCREVLGVLRATGSRPIVTATLSVFACTRASTNRASGPS